MIKRNPRIIKRHIELWKPIDGFSGYMISNKGRVKSLGRIVSGHSDCDRLLKERILKLQKGDDGYLYVKLFPKNKNKSVHSLVIEHFGDSKPTPKHECNHADGIKTNNWSTNLEWMTHQENIQHAYDMNLCNTKGETHHKSKLTEKEVRKIRKLYEDRKDSQKELSPKFGISENTVNYIINRKTWKHI